MGHTFGKFSYDENDFPRQIIVMKFGKYVVIFGISDVYDIWWRERNNFLKKVFEIIFRRFFFLVEIYRL